MPLTDRTMVTLQPVISTEHRPLIAEWLRQPHVTQWWGDPDERLQQFEVTPASDHRLIAADNIPVGYIRWQTVDRAVLDAVGLTDIPTGAVDIDLFIGEPEKTGQAIGPGALELLIKILEATTKTPLAGLTTSQDNARALRAFEKSGFRRHLRYNDPAFGTCWVLVRPLSNNERRQIGEGDVKRWPRRHGT